MFTISEHSKIIYKMFAESSLWFVSGEGPYVFQFLPIEMLTCRLIVHVCLRYFPEITAAPKPVIRGLSKDFLGLGHIQIVIRKHLFLPTDYYRVLQLPR
jgi:hypothetical protein